MPAFPRASRASPASASPTIPGAATEVDAVLAEAVAAGATLVKSGTEAFWGGYVAYFSDPDGFLWEVTWNPGFTLDEHGAVHLPP